MGETFIQQELEQFFALASEARVEHFNYNT